MKKFLIILIVLQLFLTHIHVALAVGDLPSGANPNDYTKSGVQAQIEEYLCAPTPAPKDKGETNFNYLNMSPADTAAANNNGSNDLYNCINKMYRFAIVLGSVMGVFYIVLAGYLYINSAGSSEAVDKAKSMFTSSITAMVILFAGYILLRALNPDLIKFQNIQPPSIRIEPSAAPALSYTGGTTTPPLNGASTGDVTPLAGRILSNSANITLATVHPSGIPDSANAAQNIKDAAAGKPATRSSYLGAPGGTVYLNPNMLAALAAIGDKYKIEVSEIAGGSHSQNSKHYTGNAFDINYINGKHLTAPNIAGVQDVMAMCTALGGKPNDETTSANHVHCDSFPAPKTTTVTTPGQCNVLNTGSANVNSLKATCFGANAERASKIANKESGGDPSRMSRVDKCEPGGEEVSFGLFQINITAHKIGTLDCPKAFDKLFQANNKTCKVVNKPLYDQCKAAALTESKNITAACVVTANGTNWQPYNNACPNTDGTPSAPGPTVQVPDINKIIKSWTGEDPYPNAKWDTTKPALKTAYEAFNQAWIAQGNNALAVRQVYRPKEYQDHIRSIWEAWRLKNNNTSTDGYRCNEISHLSTSDVVNMTASQNSILNSEVSKHSTAIEKTPPACISDHSQGIAIDITPPATSGALYKKWIEVGVSVGLCHYIAGDQPHFALRSELPTGTNCSVE